MSAHNPTWLNTTVEAVRELMQKRIDSRSLPAEEQKEVQLALEELEVVWEELQGQSTLLAREYERYAAFFDYAPDAYLITDMGGNIRDANRAARELFLLDHDDLVGHPLGRFMPESERTAYLSRFVTLLNQAEPRPASWAGRVQSPGMEPMAVRFSVRSIPLKKTGFGGFCWLIRPVE
jgi:PAS domain S-box-containing protein